jgi:hypothetical protein
VRFLFALRHDEDARNLSSTLELLAEYGHEIVIVVDSGVGPGGLVARLVGRSPRISAQAGVGRVRQADRDLGRALRSWVDYLWFFEPALAGASRLRYRAGRTVPLTLRGATEAVAQEHDARRALMAAIRALEWTLPIPEGYRSLVEAVRPDVVAVTPLVRRGSPQVNYLRAAQLVGVRTAYCVASWDNLTTKGTVHAPTELVTVWNAAQRQEAVDLHGIDPGRIAVTGAPLYDEWFGREPSTSRSEFVARVGLPSDRPFVLYACSSKFLAPDEAAWIVDWLKLLRGSGHPGLSALSVLVRQHPANRLLDDTEPARRLLADPLVAIYPGFGVLASAGAGLTDYYDSLHYAAAVVGINTSAMIEAALVERGVYVLTSERLRESQEELPHFAHLRTAGGGLIVSTSEPSEHAAALAAALRGDGAAEASARARAFVASFIRPFGLDEPATPRMVDALEAVRDAPRLEPTPVSGPVWPGDAVAELERIFGVRSPDRPRKRRPKTR